MKPMSSPTKWIALPSLAMGAIAIAIALGSIEQWSADFPLQGNGQSALSNSSASALSDRRSSEFSEAFVPSSDPFSLEPSTPAPSENPLLITSESAASESAASESAASELSLSHSSMVSRAESGSEITQGFNCENPQYQQEMNYCAQIAYQEADEALNETYNRLLETLSAARRENLVAAELAWIAYRDATCEFERSRYEGGSIAPLIYYSCMAQLTQEQTLRLENYLQNVNSMTLQNFSSAPPVNELRANGENPLKWINVLSYKDLSD